MKGTIISWQSTPITLLLCASCLFITYPLLNTGYGNAIFNSLMISQYVEGLTEILEGQVWRLVSPIFMHGSWAHLLFNGLNLIVFGSRVEIAEGKQRYILITLLCAIGANLAQWFVRGPLFLGISGVIFGHIGFLGIRQWRYSNYPFYLPKSFFVFVALIILVGLSGLLEKIFGMKIANTSHIAGLIIGMALAFIPPPRRG